MNLSHLRHLPIAGALRGARADSDASYASQAGTRRPGNSYLRIIWKLWPAFVRQAGQITTMQALGFASMGKWTGQGVAAAGYPRRLQSDGEEAKRIVERAHSVSASVESIKSNATYGSATVATLELRRHANRLSDSVPVDTKISHRHCMNA